MVAKNKVFFSGSSQIKVDRKKGRYFSLSKGGLTQLVFIPPRLRGKNGMDKLRGLWINESKTKYGLFYWGFIMTLDWPSALNRVAMGEGASKNLLISRFNLGEEGGWWFFLEAKLWKSPSWPLITLWGVGWVVKCSKMKSEGVMMGFVKLWMVFGTSSTSKKMEIDKGQPPKVTLMGSYIWSESGGTMEGKGDSDGDSRWILTKKPIQGKWRNGRYK